MPTYKSFSHWLNNLPVRHKLLALTGLVSGLSLCVAIAAVTFLDWRLHRELMLKNAQAQAEILAGNSSAALVFRDKDSALENFAPLAHVEGVAAAALFNIAQEKFIEYHRNPDNPLILPPLQKDSYEEYRGDQLFIQKVILKRGKKVGQLLMINDLKPFHTSLYIIWFFSGGIVILSLALGWLLFQRMQRIITEPVQTLSIAMKSVSSLQDYGLRIEVHSDDELGGLARGFNDMLQQIEKRDTKLESYNRDLEHAVQQRTNELAITVESLIEAKDKAEKANQAKSRFLANVSHELRTPLNAILGFADILHQKCTTGLEKKYIHIILGSGKTLLNLINEILDLARIEAGKLKLEYSQVDLRQLLTDVSGFFTPKVENKNLELQVDISDELPSTVMLDQTRIQQILINLLGNAVKFTESGYVRLSAQVRWLNSTHSLLELHLLVEDTGIGIPEAEHDRIFRAFEQQEQQSQNQFGGTGLGLAITKNLVEIMQGEISVNSQPGRGSCFSVIFHEVEVSSTIAETPQAHTDDSSITFKSAQILIADDIELNRELLKAYLIDYPFNIIEARNGQEVLEQVENYTPDLILLDIKMPILNGEEAAKQLKNNPATASIPLIAVTAHAMQEDVERYKELCDDYLPKPVSNARLKQKLLKFLPYQQADKPTLELQDTDVQTEIQTHDIMPEALVQTLHDEYKAHWNLLDHNSPINAVSDFAGLIVQLAKQHHYPPLIHWGHALCEHADSFDIPQMHETLAEFEQFL